MEKAVQGRKFNIDYELVEKLAEVGCQKQEVASILGCTIRTLQRDPEAMAAYDRGTNELKRSLRITQLQMARKSATMGIWLGKQILGQRDTVQITTHTDGEPDALTKSILASMGSSANKADENESELESEE